MDILALLLIATAVITPMCGFILHMVGLVEKYINKENNKPRIDGALLFYSIGFISSTLFWCIFYLPSIWSEIFK